MKIFYKDDYIDFEAPIYMNEGQRNKFIEGMRLIFKDGIEVANIIENKKGIDSINRHPKKFSEDDQIILADPNLSNYEIAQKMGKTPFAIQMKRGPFLMELQEWSRKKGKHSISEEDVRSFLEEER